MIVPTIFVLFLPPLLLAEGNFNIGPFHRSPPEPIPQDSPKISSNSPPNQQGLKSSPTGLPRRDHPKPPQIVKERPIKHTEKTDSVVPVTFERKIDTDLPADIQTQKPRLAQSVNPVYTNNRHQDTSTYHVPKHTPNSWTPPKPPTLPSVGFRRAYQPVHAHATSYVHQPPPPITPVSAEKSISVEPSTLPPIISTDPIVEIQTPKPAALPSVGLRIASQPVQVHPTSYVYQPPSPTTPVSTEKCISVEPSTLPSIISIDPLVEIQTPKPAALPSAGLRVASQPIQIHPTSYVHQPPPPFTPVSTEKSVSVEPSTLPPIISTDPKVEIQTPEPPALSSVGLRIASQPVQIHSTNYVHHTPPSITPVSTEKSISVEPSTLPPIISTEPLVEIQTPEPSLSNSQLPVHAGDRHLDSYNVPRPASIPWRPRDLFTNSSEDISASIRASQPTTSQPMLDKIRHREIGPYHRPPRSAAPWDEQKWDSFAEDRIPQSNTLQRFMCPQAHGYFKYTDKCHEYIECKNYVALAYACPDGFHFNPQAEWTEYPCDHPSNVQCNEEPTLPTTATPATPIPTTKVVTTPRPNNQKPNGFMCSQPHGYFKFNDRCEEYIECKNYVPLMFSCPVGLHFNPRADWTEYPCDHPLIVQCDQDLPDEDTTRPPTTRPPPPPSTTRPPPPPTTRPPPPPPPTTRRPPPPPTTRRPPPPPTTRRPPPPPTTRRPPPPPPTTRRPPPPPPTTRRPPPPPPTTRLPPPPPTTRPPPPPPTTTPVSITTSPKNPPDYNICLRPYGYFKFSDHCGEYIECKNHVPLIFTCPAGLHFNHLAEWTEYPCDHPSKVQCDGEPVYPLRPPTTQPPPTPTTPPVVTAPHPGSKLYDFKCPQANGYFKHGDECSEYIECKNYVPLAYKCPGGLYFNIFADWTGYPCDHPSNVQCYKELGTKQPTENPNVRPTPAVMPNIDPRFPTLETVRPPTERPSYEPIDFYCQQPNGYYSVASQCDAYIECKDSKAIKHFCPAGLYYNSKTQWPDFPCNYASRVQCDKGADDSNIPVTRPNIGMHRFNFGTPPPTVRTPPTERPSNELIDFFCREPNAYYSVASQCDTYIECKNNRAIQHVCPDGLYFNPKAQWPRFPCNYPSRVQCNNGSVIDDSNIPVTRPDIGMHRPPVVTSRPITVTPFTPRYVEEPTVRYPPSKQFFNYSCPESNGFYSVASQCDVYVECVSDMAIEHSCPDGLHFNPNVQWPDYPCGYPSEVQCSSGDVVQPANPTANCPHRDGFFPSDSDDCGEYIVCHAGVAVIEHCPAGLVFNFDKDTCDWPVNVPECNQPRALEGFVCPGRSYDEDGLRIYKYRYGRSCKSFVACQEGHPRLLSCDAGLHFNEETESCVDSTLVVDCDA